MNYAPQISNDNNALAIGCAQASSLGFTLALYDDLDSLKDVWTAFECDSTADVFQYYGFISSWMKHIGTIQNVEPLIVTGHEQNGRLAFILPFGVRKIGPFRILEWLGASVSNYQSGLYSQSFLAQINPVSFKVLWRDITALLPRFDCLHLQNQPEYLAAKDNPFSAFYKLFCADPYFDFALSSDYDALFTSKRSAKSIRTLHKRERKFETLGTISFCHESDPHKITEAVDAILHEKNLQLARLGRSEKFPEAMRDLFHELCQSQDGKAPVYDLFLLKLDDQLVAASINARHKDTICGIVLFMFKGEYSKFSPGDRLLRATIQWACENGLKTFDLSLGRMPYKLVWADEEKHLFETILPQNLLGWAYSVPISCLCRIRHMIKSSDRLTRFLLRWAKWLNSGN